VRWVGIVLRTTGLLGLDDFQRVGLAIGLDQDAAAGNTSGLKIKGGKHKTLQPFNSHLLGKSGVNSLYDDVYGKSRMVAGPCPKCISSNYIWYKK
jgi:hypothetical protein